MAEEEVVGLDVSMDNPHAVNDLDQAEQLGGQVDGDRLDDDLVRVLGEVDQVEEGAHALPLGDQDAPVPGGGLSSLTPREMRPTCR